MISRAAPIRLALIWLVVGGAANAVELTLPPTAQMMAERNTAPDRYMAPVTVFENGGVRTLEIEGRIERAAWRIGSPGLSPLQVLAPVRRQLEAAGFRILLDCSASVCGGFDFRFATETLPGPNMYVNIRAYQFLTAVSGPRDAPDHVVTVLVSTSASSAHIQIIEASEQKAQGASTADPTSPVTQTDASSQGSTLADRLLGQGHFVVQGLDFDSGTSVLVSQDDTPLKALAAFLLQNPDVRIAVVGHTDTVGGLDANITLSRARASSVRQALIQTYDITPDRIEAQGVGYLAPVASNLTAEGRDANRRVEIVILTP